MTQRQYKKKIEAELKQVASVKIYDRIKIFSGTTLCSKAVELNGKIFTLEEALKDCPIPDKECNNKEPRFCTCSYIPLTKGEE